jgi:beta-glucosidase
VVTFSHWTTPRWFAMRGGWTAPDSATLFARFCDRAARHLADGMAYAVTLNEANGTLLGHVMAPPQAKDAERAMLAAAGRATGSEHFVGGSPISLAMEMLPNLIAAHKQARAAIKAARPALPVGMSLALVDLQGVGPNNLRDARRRDFYGAWLEAVRGDDFVGVQNTAASSGTTRASSPCRWRTHRRRRLGDLPRLAGQCGRLCPCRNRLPDHGHRARPQQRQ